MYKIATKKDFEDLEKISIDFSLWLNKSEATKKNFDLEKFVEKEKQFFKKNFNKKEHTFIICNVENQLAAYVFIGVENDNSSQGFIAELFVQPKFRKKGIASELIKQGTKILKEKKCKEISITVFSKNKKAIQLYEKLGYKREENYFVDYKKKI